MHASSDQRPRTRPSTSCNECRRRKQRCNQSKDRPCNNCARRYPPVACVYGSSSRSSYSPLADEIRLQEDTKDDLRSRAGDDLPLINSRSNRASGYGSQLSGNGTSPYFIPEDQQSPLQLSTTTSQSIQISVTSAPHSSYFPPQSHSQNQWSSQPYATSTSLNVPTSSSYNQSENYYASDFDTEEGYRGYRSGGYDDGWHSGHGDAGIPGTGDMDDLLDDYLIDNEGGNTDFWSHEVPDEERRYGY